MVGALLAFYPYVAGHAARALHRSVSLATDDGRHTTRNSNVQQRSTEPP